MFLCGDVMTGRGIDQILHHPGDPRLFESWLKSAIDYVDLAERKNGPIPRSVAPSYIWGDALDVFNAVKPDALIINLESAVTDKGDPWPGKAVHYRMQPDNLECLTVAGVDCCVLANNHILDWSVPGLEQTLDSLPRVGLTTAGAGADADSAAQPATVDAGGGSRVLVVAVGSPSSGIPESWGAGAGRPGVALVRSLSSAEVDSVAATVDGFAQPGDIVVASIHWGPNWGYHVAPAHQRFARALIDRAGVHVVHGHSSHHPLRIEVYRDRPILYGCGDLINDYEGISGHEEFRPDLGLLYSVTLDRPTGRLTELELVPVQRKRLRLTSASTVERDWLKTTLSREGQQVGTAIDLAEDGRMLVRW